MSGTWTGFLPPRSVVMARSKAPGAPVVSEPTIAGEGNPDARLVFVGEGPGGPYEGKAGQLLAKMIEAMGLRREDVFICNVVGDTGSFASLLEQKLDLTRPQIVVALGDLASRMLLRTEDSVSSLRGNFHAYRGAKLMPTWHPAHLLQNPESKKEAWEDLKKVAQELGIQIPQKKGGSA